MTSYERHGVSKHRSFDCLFNSLCGPTSQKHQRPHYWPFVMGIYRWPVNSSQKGSVTWKKLPFDDVIMGENDWYPTPADYNGTYRIMACSEEMVTMGVLRRFEILCRVVSWWRNEMETFSRYWPFVRGIHRLPVNSPHQGQWRGALMFSFICAWTNGSVNNRDAGDLRRHNAH